MKVIQGVDQLDRTLGRLFIVIGVFDGLHLGHEYLLRELGRAAAGRSATPTVITFDHHPDEVITGVAPPLLYDPGERLDRLEAAGVEVTVVQTFDVQLRMTAFDVFVRGIAARAEIAGFLMTPESAFGHDRGGTPETVATLGHELGYEVVVVPPLLVDGRPVSSGAIRGAIAEGRLSDAERLLGRPYAVGGEGHIVGPDETGAAGEARGVDVRFQMPVALPPPGTYSTIVNVIDGSGQSSVEGRVRVGTDQAVHVDAPNSHVGATSRLRIVFGRAVQDRGTG